MTAPHPMRHAATARLARKARCESKRSSPADKVRPQSTAPKREGEDILLWLHDFFAQVSKIVEAVVGPHGRHQRRQECADAFPPEVWSGMCNSDGALLS